MSADRAPRAAGVKGAAASPKRRRWWPRTVRHLAELLVAGFVLEYVVVPQIGGTHKALHVLAGVNPFLPLAGLFLEVLSLLAYFGLTRSLLPKSSDPGFATVSRIELSTLAVSHCLAGGNLVGYSLGYGLLTRTGVSGTDAGVALASQGLGSAVMLNAIFWMALLASLPVYGFHPVYLIAAVLGLILMLAILALVVLFTKGDARATAVLRTVGMKLPFLQPDTLPRLFNQLVQRAHELAKDKDQLVQAIAYASANWLFDAGSLFLFVGAFGKWEDPAALLVAYGLANIAGAIPITPGGLGVIEGTLSSILVAFGTPRSIAIWGVLGWRLVNFWLPIPIGGLAYLSLRVHPPADNQAGLAARRALWRARWHSFAELFERDAPARAIHEGLAVIERGGDKDASNGSVAAGGAKESTPAGEVRTGQEAPPDGGTGSGDAPGGGRTAGGTGSPC
ncbi:MAG TPA: YbhN family protein [Acidimicrobiales bacterium]|nr:YbhN family protein [Acidimicrobiales bacterium]